MSDPQHGNFILEKAEEAQLELAQDAPPAHDAAAEKKLVRKLDLVLTPLFFLVYIITFIDRANIGNARVAGLEKDLGLVGYQYNISLTVFYIFYALFEMPSNIVCKWMGARWWIPLQVFAFGTVCMCTGFINNFAGLIVVRVLLGLAEAGVLPALAFVLSRFYKRDELVLRLNICVSAAALAGGFGGLLASGFISAGEVGSLKGAWRSIFIWEGLITIGLSVLIACFSVSGPSDAWWLSAEQRELAVTRMGHLTEASRPDAKSGNGVSAVWRYLKTPIPWICSLGYLSTNVAVQGASLFSPTILRAMYPDLPTVQIQLRSVPPYIVAWVWTLALAFCSMKTNKRGIFLAITIPFALAGYGIFVGTGQADTQPRYAGIFLGLMGTFPGGPMWMAWAIGSAATDTERAIASGLTPGFGQFGAIIATWTYLPNDAPNYYTGNSMELGFCSFQLLLVFALLFYVTRENRIRRAGGRDYLLEGKEGKEGELGSRHPAWLFPI